MLSFFVIVKIPAIQFPSTATYKSLVPLAIINTVTWHSHATEHANSCVELVGPEDKMTSHYGHLQAVLHSPGVDDGP